MTPASDRRGLGFRDLFLTLGVVALIAAVAWPWISGEMLVRRAQAVGDDVEALRSAAERYRAVKGTWPPDGPAGAAPSELAPFLPAELEMTRPTHRLEWDRWETVTEPEVGPPGPEQPPDLSPPPRPDTARPGGAVFGAVAGVTVHTRDPRLLGLLLDRYGPARSFVRDSSWTLVLAATDTTG